MHKERLSLAFLRKGIMGWNMRCSWLVPAWCKLNHTCVFVHYCHPSTDSSLKKARRRTRKPHPRRHLTSKKQEEWRWVCKANKKSLQFLVIGWLQNRCVDVLFFLANREIRDTCTCGNQISHTQSMAAKRGLTNRANIHVPYVNKSFKAQHGRISIDLAILVAIGHRFIANIKRKFKMQMHRSEAMRAETRNWSPLGSLFYYKDQASNFYSHL